MFESEGLSEVHYFKSAPEHTDHTKILHSLISIRPCSRAIMVGCFIITYIDRSSIILT